MPVLIYLGGVLVTACVVHLIVFVMRRLGA